MGMFKIGLQIEDKFVDFSKVTANDISIGSSMILHLRNGAKIPAPILGVEGVEYVGDTLEATILIELDQKILDGFSSGANDKRWVAYTLTKCKIYGGQYKNNFDKDWASNILIKFGLNYKDKYGCI